jgi:hypothetical protein
MSRPYTDIARINNDKGINNKAAVCSTLPTGKSSVRIIRPNYPVNLTIENVQQKYGNRFYNGIFVNVLSGDINGGSST